VALDTAWERYGPGAVTRAILLGQEYDPTLPILPD
jgi:hypothetical protein